MMLSGAEVDEVAMQAITLGLVVLFTLLFAYRSGDLPISDKNAGWIRRSSLLLILPYVLYSCLVFFEAWPFGPGTLAWWSFAGVVLAAINVLFDLYLLDQTLRHKKAPSFPHPIWGLLLDLCWLFLEIHQLLGTFSAAI